MPKKKKGFIIKKNSTTYKLIPNNAASSSQDEEKRKEEQVSCGIYFEDNYDYMQHLRTRTDQAKSQDFIEVSVIRNETKENVQQNHQAHATDYNAPFRPREPETKSPELDADIMDVLEGGDVDEEIEDNFIEMANQLDEEANGIKNNESNNIKKYIKKGGGDELDEEEFKNFYERFQGDDIEFEDDFESVDDGVMTNSMDLLNINYKKKNVHFEEIPLDKEALKRTVMKSMQEPEDKEEVVTVDYIDRSSNIDTATGSFKSSKNQPKTVSIQFDKKKSKKKESRNINK